MPEMMNVYQLAQAKKTKK